MRQHAKVRALQRANQEAHRDPDGLGRVVAPQRHIPADAALALANGHDNPRLGF